MKKLISACLALTLICSQNRFLRIIVKKKHLLSAVKGLRDTKLRVEQAKKRINELDGLISASFEQFVSGTIKQATFKIFCDKYESEQRELTKYVTEAENDILAAKQESVDLMAFLTNIRKCQTFRSSRQSW